MQDSLVVLSGNAHPELAKKISEKIGVPLGEMEVFKFADDESFCKINVNIRKRDVFIIQPTCRPVNDNLMELLIIIDACKRASARSITAVVPYYGYSRTDKKDQPRVPITAKLVADLLTVAGASRVLTVDLHAAQIQGFFNIPVDELTALNILGNYFKKKGYKDVVVVASDIGATKRARDLGAMLNVPLAIMEKRRLGNEDKTETLNVIGDVKDKIAITVDDEIDTAGSLVGVVTTLINHGAREIHSCCTHPIFSGPAIERISASPVKEVVVTDTVPVPEQKRIDKITVIPIAPLLGEAIKRIHTGQSVGAMFE